MAVTHILFELISQNICNQAAATCLCSEEINRNVCWVMTFWIVLDFVELTFWSEKD